MGNTLKNKDKGSVMRFLNAFFVAFFLAIAIVSSAFMTLGYATEPPSRIRLLDGGRDGSDYLAALEISLAPGYLTYWRTPGEAGLAPVIDWSSSKNIADISVAWPAPDRLLEADSVVYGFHNQVLIPLRITPKIAGEAVELTLSLQYGVCKEICIPVDAKASIALSGQGDNAVIVQRALRNLPEKTAIGSEAALSILKIERGKTPAELIVTLRHPPETQASLFAEGPQGWLYSTSEAVASTLPGQSTFSIKIEERPSQEKTGVPLTLTAKAGKAAIETRTRIE